ncbi:MAG: hypothetical protein Q8P67_09605, partial [archaeon]|nr:hypothetical protein [archaeon]
MYPAYAMQHPPPADGSAPSPSRGETGTAIPPQTYAPPVVAMQPPPMTQHTPQPVSILRYAATDLPKPSCEELVKVLSAAVLSSGRDPNMCTLIDCSGQKIESRQLTALLECAGKLNVHTLELRNARMTSNSATALGKALAQRSKPFNSLRSLDLSGNNDFVNHDNAGSLFRALNNNPGLTKLNLGSMKLRDEGCKALAVALFQSSNPCSLRDLNLSHNLVTVAGITALVEALLGQATPAFPRPYSASDGFRSSAVLQSLTLTHNPQIGVSGIAALTHWLGRPDCQLVHLFLTECGIGAEGCELLVDAIANRNNLQLLSLGDSKLGATRGPAAVAKLLARCNSLRELYLLSNALGAAGIETIVADGLRKNTTLRLLDLESNHLQDSGLRPLLEELGRRGKSEDTIHSLNLANNGITSRGFIEVFSLLLRNPALKQLDISRNNLGDTIVPVLVDFFRCNNRMWSLDMSLSKLSAATLASIIPEVRRSYALRQFRFLQTTLSGKSIAQSELGPLPPPIDDYMKTVTLATNKNRQLLLNRQHTQRSAIQTIMDISRQPNLAAFNFSHTPLETLPPSFTLLHPHLIELILFDCSLVDVSVFTHSQTQYALEILVLRRNLLRDLPPLFDNLPLLRVL